jgi:hypothetical protein
VALTPAIALYLRAAPLVRVPPHDVASSTSGAGISPE